LCAEVRSGAFHFARKGEFMRKIHRKVEKVRTLKAWELKVVTGGSAGEGTGAPSAGEGTGVC